MFASFFNGYMNVYLPRHTAVAHSIKIKVPMTLYVTRVLANLPLKVGRCEIENQQCVCDDSKEEALIQKRKFLG